jgi:dTDP-4-dehydrorhamnose reductase
MKVGVTGQVGWELQSILMTVGEVIFVKPSAYLELIYD